MMENLAPLALPSLLAPGLDGTQNLKMSLSNIKFSIG
jgi:hypothetical protein